MQAHPPLTVRSKRAISFDAFKDALMHSLKAILSTTELYRFANVIALRLPSYTPAQASVSHRNADLKVAEMTKTFLKAFR